MNEEQPMLAKITKGKECNWRFWQEDSYTEFDDIAAFNDGKLFLIEFHGNIVLEKLTIKPSSAKEFLRCFEIVKGKL